MIAARIMMFAGLRVGEVSALFLVRDLDPERVEYRPDVNIFGFQVYPDIFYGAWTVGFENNPEIWKLMIDVISIFILVPR